MTDQEFEICLRIMAKQEKEIAELKAENERIDKIITKYVGRLGCIELEFLNEIDNIKSNMLQDMK